MPAVRRIGLLGGESTGKSTLAAELARRLPACVVEEALRAFVAERGRVPVQAEQAALLERQWQDEQEAARTCPTAVLVADPAPLMTAVYSELYFADTSLMATGAERARVYDLVVWCAPDIPWHPDAGQRDGEQQRDAADRIIARVVAEELVPRGIRVIRVTGDVDARAAAVGQAWQPGALSRLPRLARVETSGPADGLVGSTVDGRYRVLSMLARGGMATVYEALDLRLDRVVALKIMHPHLAHDAAFVARFQREARAAARLTHGHVVAVYDQGEDNGLVYLAMEYVPGRTLRDVLRQYGPLTPEQALVFLDPVLEALGAAHAAGFVHRDIKPENVLISDDGRVKVADFGLARAVEADGQSVTHGMIIGTVAYLSPEQVERGEADGRSDVYAAGILLFEMITGQVPHAGESPLSVAYQHVNTDVPAPSTVRAGIPPEVDALVVTSTRRDPSLRYQNALDFLADVRRVRAALPPPRPFVDAHDTLVVDVGMSSALAAPRPTPPRGTAAARTQPVDTQVRYRRSRAPWIVILLVIAVLGTAVGAWYLAAGPGRTVTTPDVAGQPLADAQAAMSAAGLTLEVAEEQYSEQVPAQSVISTDPPAGEGVRAEGTVTAIVSKGPERYDVPAVKGLTQQEAADAIAAANLAVGRVKQAFDDKAEVGTVVSTTPKAGTSVKPGTPVDVVVSKGPEPVPVPDVVGRKAGAAKDALGAVGLKADVTQKFSEEVPDGVVISVKPKAGTIVDSGSRVALVVSKGPPPVTVPSLIDVPRDRAVSILQGLGLKANVVEGDFSPLNRVISQDPVAGTKIPKGSTVTIRII